ncbi:MAG: hypothetical protein KAW56_15510, partial [Candidatus Marinimicrobia bacterium]|nr:hypothetical protein [Candidatus Neomarinimicrobiota bacterium]
DSKFEELVSSPGCGYYYSVSWDKNRVGFKLIDENGNQIPALLDLSSKEVIKLHDPVKQAGQVSFTKDGRYAFTIGEQLIISDGNTYQLGYYSNIAPISPDGNYAVYNDNNDQIWLLNLNTKEKVMISDSELGYFYPKWAGDSQKLLYSGFSGIIIVYDIKSKMTFVLDEGHNPSWSNDSEFVIYFKKEIEGLQLINSDLYVSKFDGSITTRLTNTADVFEMDPQFSENDQRMIFHSYNKREIISAKISSTKNSLSERKVLYKCSEDFKIKYYKVKPVFEKTTVDDVPYLHQVYDTPNWFWGYYACAPTTAAMVLAYYNILPKWETTCSSPYSHKSYWGRYICEKYHYREYYYNLGSSPGGHATGYGG